MIKVQGLTHHYDGLLVLSDVTFTVPKEEFVAIVGPNGCGKSTLLRLVAGLDTPSAGSVVVDGERVEGPGSGRGFVFQEYALFPWLSVRRNVEFGLTLRGVPRVERRQISDDIIGRVGLSGFENYRPAMLSGGMKQRTAIARALANNPRVLLMDEPFAALDAQTRTQMQDELQRVWQEGRQTILFVTHSFEEAVALADRVIVLSSRPTHLVDTITIDLTHPRRRASAEFLAICDRIAEALRSSAPVS